MKVTFWGTRGSIPVSGPQFVRHGGSTTCLEICAGEERVIIDCGSGLSALGKERGPSLLRAELYQTHMHWDHVQGFPFFGPLFNPAAHFSLHAVPRQGQGMRDVLHAQMSQPTFPVGLEIIPAKLQFHDLPLQGESQHGELAVRWREVNHPGGSSAYRFDYEGASLVFSGDVEVAGMTHAEPLIELARDADVLVMDAQYFPDEYRARVGFGHSSIEDAVEVALRANVSRLILTHHDPAHDDVTLAEKLRLAREISHDTRLIVDNAYDRMVLDLRPPTRAPRPGLATLNCNA